MKNKYIEKENHIEMIIESKVHGIFNVLLDKEDFTKVKDLRWYVEKHKKEFYVFSNSLDGGKTKVRLHRYIIDCPKNMVVDHINNNPLDNRKCNLRQTTHSDNLRYKKSKYRGVRPRGNKFQVQFMYKGKRHYLGVFDTYEEGAKALKQAKLEVMGNFRC